MDVFEEARQLSRMPIFSKLDKSRLKLIAFNCEQLQLTDGEYLFHLNDFSDSVFLILQGTLEVVTEQKDGRVEVILDRGNNETIGEMGVISNTPRSASIRALGTVKLLRIEADMFMELLTENPSMSLYVMRELSARLKEITQQQVKAHV